MGGGSKRGATNRLVAALWLTHMHALTLYFILGLCSLCSLSAQRVHGLIVLFWLLSGTVCSFRPLVFCRDPRTISAPSAQELRPGKGTRSRQTNQKDPERVTGRRMNVV